MNSSARRHLWWSTLAEEGGEAAQQRMGGALADDASAASMRKGQAQQWRVRVRQAVGEALGVGDADGVLLRELLGHAPVASGQDWRAALAVRFFASCPEWSQCLRWHH